MIPLLRFNGDKPSLFQNFLCTLCAWFPNVNIEVLRFITAQVMLETGWCTSNIYTDNCNCVGMRHPKFRVTLSKSQRNGHAVYSNPFESFCDYFIWMQYNRFTMADLRSLDLFMDKLGKSDFNPSPKYVSTIYSIYLKYRDYE